ncbi:MAG: hypothetical protein EXR86_01985 [Gammaproteobacteria bacterium]|nr:hypothetical protein [Gammaproteobacteria bacterium]
MPDPVPNNSAMPPARNRWLWGLTTLIAASVFFVIGQHYALRKVVPSVVPVVIQEAQLEFAARLDTGAEVSSINATDVAVIGGEGRPTRRDIGRQVAFTVLNERGERARLQTKIIGIHAIKTADCREFRYHVSLTVQRDGRAQSAEKLLLGRNWLEAGYLVDVTRRR